MKRLYILLLFYCPLFLHAQDAIKGKLLDSQTKAPLAFVNILINESNRGFSTDIDGKFELTNNKGVESLTFSYLGYEQVTYRIEELRGIDFKVLLKRNDYKLKEVEILPGVNPAHRIIDAAIENREINNPEKASQFFYESYNKLIFTAKPDSIYLNQPDSIRNRDSSSIEALDYLEKKHFFITESITERNHIPPTHSKEVVTASRISGLKTPFFSLIGTQLQSFSLYTNYIQLFSYSYLSPISKGSTSKYLFVLEDTIFQGSDTIYSISFRPRRGKNFDGLKGVLTINTDGYAVQNFIAETFDQEDINVKIQQNYEKVDQKQWFPVQLNTTLYFESLEIDDFRFYGEGKSYIKNIQLESKLSKGELGNVILKMGEDAGKKDSTYWEKHRVDALTQKEKDTYVFIDSLGESINLDKKLFVYQALFRGAFPIGPIDLSLKHLLNFNGYEGFRLGLGGETNDHVMKNFRVGAYGAYGFKDEGWKYGGHFSWKRTHGSHLSAKLAYANDVTESGGTTFYNDWINPFSTEALQKFFIIDMDDVERYEFQLETHAVRDFQTVFFVNHQIRNINSDYRFSQLQRDENGILGSEFNLTEAGINIRYVFREKFVEMFGVKTPVSYQYPVIHLKLTRGFDEELDGSFEYNRVDLKVQKLFKLKNLGVSSLRFSSGYIDRAIPITAMFRAKGIRDSDLLYAADFSFQTARPNEFFHDRYMSFFFKHSFKNLLFKTKFFKPELALVTNIGWGTMRDKNQHENIQFSTMDKGFFESGIQLDRLFGFVDYALEEADIGKLGFSNFGIGVYYRYGKHELKSTEDNIRLKATYTFSF